jgi:basic membrane lipoprotein Med (substrate-binding protein (PBP1-ABC) superfamily)
MRAMRKWLVLLLAIALLYALPKLNTRWSRRRFPLMKRIDQAVLNICQLVRENTFRDMVETTGGNLRLGMAEGASGASTLAMLDDLGVSENIKATIAAMRNAQPAWVWEGASALENKILSGEITILRVTDHDTAENYRTLWA